MVIVSADDQVKAYIKKIMSQLDKWMVGGKISKLVIVITDKDTGEHVERWQFDVRVKPLGNSIGPRTVANNMLVMSETGPDFTITARVQVQSQVSLLGGVGTGKRRPDSVRTCSRKDRSRDTS